MLKIIKSIFYKLVGTTCYLSSKELGKEQTILFGRFRKAPKWYREENNR